MKTRAEEFAGLTVAMITPFKNGKIDFDTLQEQVEFLIEGGVSVLAPTGTTGESPTLTHEEQHEVIRKVVEFANGRVKVLAGTGSNNTEEALSLTRYAESVGATPRSSLRPITISRRRKGFISISRRLPRRSICERVYNVPVAPTRDRSGDGHPTREHQEYNDG